MFKKIFNIKIATIIAITLCASANVMCNCITNLVSGEKGVYWNCSSGTSQEIYNEGCYCVAPWNKMFIYNTRILTREEQIIAQSKDGLTFKMDLDIQFQVNPNKLYEIQTNIGQAYYESVIQPQLRSIPRIILGNYSPEEIYSTKRGEIELQISKEIAKVISKYDINVIAVPIRNIALPEILMNAINNKNTKQQESQAMEYVLQKQRQEAERMLIEAQGIRDYQATVTQGITSSLLEWKAIEAMEKFATTQTPNKTFVIGVGDNGLPMFFNSN